jgi:competence protein ComEC
VHEAFITPFDDDRPMASFVQSALARRAIPTTTVGCGSTGYLGDVPWVVLQPEQHAVGSEDSNDASIAMRFDFANSTVFTFADLGERAQMRLVRNHPGLLTMSPGRHVVIKVAHHGSGDQYPELLESLNADVALISVGKNNSYGHPTSRTLRIFDSGFTRVIRTDLSGSIALVESRDDIIPSVSGGG